MGKVGWDDYRRKIKKKGGRERKESTRRERLESAKGGREKKRKDCCTTIAVHSCRNDETGRGGMRREEDDDLACATATHVHRRIHAALSFHLHACECLPLCSSSFTRELSPLCTNPRGNWFMMEPRIQTRPSCILICRRYQGTRRPAASLHYAGDVATRCIGKRDQCGTSA